MALDPATLGVYVVTPGTLVPGSRARRRRGGRDRGRRDRRPAPRPRAPDDAAAPRSPPPSPGCAATPACCSSSTTASRSRSACGAVGCHVGQDDEPGDAAAPARAGRILGVSVERPGGGEGRGSGGADYLGRHRVGDVDEAGCAARGPRRPPRGRRRRRRCRSSGSAASTQATPPRSSRPAPRASP